MCHVERNNKICRRSHGLKWNNNCSEQLIKSLFNHLTIIQCLAAVVSLNGSHTWLKPFGSHFNNGLVHLSTGSGKRAHTNKNCIQWSHCQMQVSWVGAQICVMCGDPLIKAVYRAKRSSIECRPSHWWSYEAIIKAIQAHSHHCQPKSCHGCSWKINLARTESTQWICIIIF